MKFIEIEWCSDLYQAALDLRHAVLRKPLNLKLTAEELDSEHEQWHFGLLPEDSQKPADLAAVVVAKRRSASRVQLRQMAVAPQRQREGLGTELLQQSEQRLSQEGFLEVVLHARESAVDFYRKHGYQPEGEPFEEVTISHRRMTKKLDATV